MKDLLPIASSIPALLTWAGLFYRLFTGEGIPYGVALLGISFLAFTVSVAMSFVIPDSKKWRAAAVFNAIPFIVIVLALLILAD